MLMKENFVYKEEKLLSSLNFVCRDRTQSLPCEGGDFFSKAAGFKKATNEETLLF